MKRRRRCRQQGLGLAGGPVAVLGVWERHVAHMKRAVAQVRLLPPVRRWDPAGAPRMLGPALPWFMKSPDPVLPYAIIPSRVTASHPNSEVKLDRDDVVLPSGRGWEGSLSHILRFCSRLDRWGARRRSRRTCARAPAALRRRVDVYHSFLRYRHRRSHVYHSSQSRAHVDQRHVQSVQPVVLRVQKAMPPVAAGHRVDAVQV